MKLIRLALSLFLAVACFVAVSPAKATDLVITAANVKWVSGAQPVLVVAGATITAGQPVYLGPSNSYLLTNATTAGAQAAAGVALSGASSGGYFILAPQGATINIGATVVKNTVYFLSGNNSGGIAPGTDVTTGWNTYIIGVASSTTNIVLTLTGTGIQN